MLTHRPGEAAGFVLAGGQSRRMGLDKALLRIADQPLVERVARAVEIAAGSATIIGPAERYAHLGRRVIPDEKPGAGPLGGIVTALSATDAEYSVITACDLPDLTAEFLTRLVAFARSTGPADCWVPEGPNGLEPLCAVWNARALSKLRCALAAGTRKMKEVIAGIETCTFPVSDGAVFRNVNTPRDWAR
jgi:molybdopterin-guanine dinucleotide biosynthesis protein A